MKANIINFVVFQAGWLACVLSAANGLPWVGVIVAAAAVALHFVLAANAAAELRLVLVALGIGAFFDSMLISTGWVSYPSGVLAPYFAPYWILAMWALFATTLNTSLAWVKKSLPLAAALGTVCGPLSFLAGQRLGGIELIEPAAALTALAGIWAVAMPILVLAARRSNGIDAVPAALRLGVVTLD